MKDLDKEYKKLIEKTLEAFKNETIASFYEESFDYLEDDEQEDREIIFPTKYEELKKIISGMNRIYGSEGFVGEYPDGIYESTISKSPEKYLNWLRACIESQEEIMEDYEDTFEDGEETSLTKRILEKLNSMDLKDDEKVFLKLESNLSPAEFIRELFKISEKSFALLSGGDYDFATVIICKFKDYIISITINFDDIDYDYNIVNFSIETNVIKEDE